MCRQHFALTCNNNIHKYLYRANVSQLNFIINIVSTLSVVVILIWGKFRS